MYSLYILLVLFILYSQYKMNRRARKRTCTDAKIERIRNQAPLTVVNYEGAGR